MASIEEVDTLPETERYAYSRDWRINIEVLAALVPLVWKVWK